MERASGGCIISMRNILMLSKMWDVDAKFAKEVSSNPRKGKMQMQLYMIGRLKSICKFEEEQVADYIGQEKSICNSEYQALQIQQLPKSYLQQCNISQCRYNSYQKSICAIKSPHLISDTSIHHKARKRLCNPANWSRACPTKLSRSA